MEGKGWFAIYGLLVLFAIYMFAAQQSQGQQIAALKAQVVQLKQAPGAAPSPSAAPEESLAPSPDLSSPAARDAQRKADLATIRAALLQYQRDNKTYPVSLTSLVPRYHSVLPKDPLDPRYTYRYTKTTTGYKLTCVLEVKNDPDDVRSDGRADGVYTIAQ